MDLDGELPGLREQYGSRPSSHAARYVCDHMGVRRVKQRATSMETWKSMNKFVKVMLVICPSYCMCIFTHKIGILQDVGFVRMAIYSSCHLCSFLAKC